ncbi:MAG: hypothetical protein JNL73_16900 [Anaerolineales bacterium]|nr:hypothetical protein [Anaerolineales bacterium]
MSAVFKKLNLKDQAEIVVLDAPSSFESELKTLTGVTIRRKLSEVKSTGFVLAFGTRQKQVEAFARAIATKTAGDAVVWFAYPKGSSKRYVCEFNRDSGWASIGAAGFEPVRQVAIDEDWSALRFRRVEHIKTLTRSRLDAISAEGRRRIKGKP